MFMYFHSMFRFPDYTSEDILQSYRGSINRGIPSDRLKSFAQRAVASLSSKEGTPDQTGIVIHKGDCLTLDQSDIIQTAPDFRGTEIVFLDIPKV